MDPAENHNLLEVVGGAGPLETTNVVEVTDLHKWFGRNEVLKGVSMTVRQREVVVVCGPSGSGKTTFIRCVNHLEKIQGGRIFVNGHLIGYRETGSGNREVLRDKTGRILGRYESDTKVTRDASGKITGRGSNQLLRLLK